MTDVAILGCGWAGTRHFEAYRDTNATVRWVVDSDLDRARALGERADEVRTGTDYRDVLSDDGVDAVDICLPHHLHAKVAVEAAESGKHVLVEKPIADSLEAVDRMIEAADDAEVVLMVAENVRFDQTLRRVREILDAGVIGDPALVRVSREANLRDEFLQNRRWFLDEEQAAGGIMMSGGIHDVEKCRMLVDADPVSVYAAEARPRFQSMEGDDTSTATIRFDDGTTAVLVESFTAMNVETVRGEKHTLEIDGDDGSLEVDGGNRITVYTRDRHLPWSTDPTGHRNEVERADSFRTDIEHFLQCIGTNEEPITSGRPQPRSLEIVLAAYESMESERVLSIE